VESLIGTTIGGFKLERSIGSGTTGEVYQALDSTGAPAAIKVLHPGLSLFTKVQTYWDEHQKVAEISHPHMVVPSAADWSLSGRFYLVMDLLDGIDLWQALLEQSKLSPAQVLLFAGQACLALEDLHELGLYHGAIKPHNIFLVRKGGEPSRFSTRVTDFATHHLVDTARIPSGPGPGAAEAAYLAPEQFQGKGGPAADIYAMGVILCEALSGRRPFRGSTFEELAQQHQQQTPTIPDNIPAPLGEIVLKALAQQPSDRHESVAALREALEGWASKKPPELNQADNALFSKDEEASGVGAEEGPDQTVRVSLEEIEAVFDEDDVEEKQVAEAVQSDGEKGPSEQVQSSGPDGQKELSTVEEKPRSTPAAEPSEAQGGKVPQDDELAAIAEKAGAALRKDQREPSSPGPSPAQVKVEAPAAAAPQQEAEGYFDDDGDLVELPLERSVRAFVANISPTVPTEQQHAPGGNGESLDSALDMFVQEAKAWSAMLPPPVVDDRQLAELAKVPEPEPEPPKPVVATPTAEPPSPRSVAVPVIIAFAIGGALVFGGMRLFAPKPAPPGEPPSPVVSVPTPATSFDSQTAPVASPLTDAAPVAAAQADIGGGTTPADAAAATATADAAPSPAVAAKVEKPRPKIARKPRVRKPRVRKPRVRKPRPKKATAEPKKPGQKKGDWVDPFSQ